MDKRTRMFTEDASEGAALTRKRLCWRRHGPLATSDLPTVYPSYRQCTARLHVLMSSIVDSLWSGGFRKSSRRLHAFTGWRCKEGQHIEVQAWQRKPPDYTWIWISFGFQAWMYQCVCLFKALVHSNNGHFDVIYIFKAENHHLKGYPGTFWPFVVPFIFEYVPVCLAVCFVCVMQYTCHTPVWHFTTEIHLAVTHKDMQQCASKDAKEEDCPRERPPCHWRIVLTIRSYAAVVVCPACMCIVSGESSAVDWGGA